MKYILTLAAPSLSIAVLSAKHERTKITLKKGEGRLSSAEFKAIKDVPIITAMVEEGSLRFPDNEKFEEIYGSKASVLRSRMEREREQVDRREASDTNDGLADQLSDALRRLADQDERMATLEQTLAAATSGPTQAIEPAKPVAEPATAARTPPPPPPPATKAK